MAATTAAHTILPSSLTSLSVGVSPQSVSQIPRLRDSAFVRIIAAYAFLRDSVISLPGGDHAHETQIARSLARPMATDDPAVRRATLSSFH